MNVAATQQHLPLLSNISHNFRKKFEMAQNVILRGQGETDSWKTPEVEKLL